MDSSDSEGGEEVPTVADEIQNLKTYWKTATRGEGVGESDDEFEGDDEGDDEEDEEGEDEEDEDDDSGDGAGAGTSGSESSRKRARDDEDSESELPAQRPAVTTLASVLASATRLHNTMRPEGGVKKARIGITDSQKGQIREMLPEIQTILDQNPYVSGESDERTKIRSALIEVRADLEQLLAAEGGRRRTYRKRPTRKTRLTYKRRHF
jgi:hypothetical protein